MQESNEKLIDDISFRKLNSKDYKKNEYRGNQSRIKRHYEI